MSDGDPTAAPDRVRREPPAFRHVAVRKIESVSPRMQRITLGGSFGGFSLGEPAASVRLLLPGPGAALVVPTWNGNEFLLPDGRRPIIRTFTPRRFDVTALELDIEVVLHGSGAAAAWAARAEPGDEAALSGPGRGYAIDADAPAFLLAGDETALPAIGQLLEVLPADRPVAVHVEVAAPDARIAFPDHPRATVAWHDVDPTAAPGDAMAAAIRVAEIEPGTRVWVAGEAAAVHRIRGHLFTDRAIPRAHATVRGYWKHGRAGTGSE